MKIFITKILFFFIVSISSTSVAETIDYAIEISTSIIKPYGIKTIRIFDGVIAPSDIETWKILGACNNSPNLKIKIFDGVIAPFGIKTVKIFDGVIAPSSIKKVCISNARELDEKTLRKLKLIK